MDKAEVHLSGHNLPARLEFDGKKNLDDLDRICQENIDIACVRREFTEDLQGRIQASAFGEHDANG